MLTPDQLADAWSSPFSNFDAVLSGEAEAKPRIDALRVARGHRMKAMPFSKSYSRTRTAVSQA